MRYLDEEFRMSNLRDVGGDFHAACVASYLFGTCVFFSVGMLMLVRRVGGAYHQIEFPAPVATGCVLAGLICISAATSKLIGSRRMAKVGQAIMATSVVLVSVALTSSPLRFVDLAFLTSGLVAIVSVLPYSRRHLENLTGQLTKRQHKPTPHAAGEQKQHMNLDQLDPSVEQLSIRSVESDGRTTVFAKLVRHLDPGERSTSFHLAFCPPLAEPPTVTAEVMEGPEARTQIGQCLSVGARIDVRLSESSSQRQRIVVEVFAHSK
jgi:hypothetical protein